MNENDIKLIPTQWIDLDQIDLNEGQIDGLPANPRTIDPIDFETLKRSITENPEMLGLKTLLVYEWKGRFVDMLADALGTQYPPLGIALLMKGEHLCKTMRGAKKKGLMTSSYLTGIFKTEAAVRAEFMQIVNK